VLITQRCLEPARNEAAILRYAGRGSLNNRLLFDRCWASSECQVGGRYAPNAFLRRLQQPQDILDRQLQRCFAPPRRAWETG